MAEAFAWICRDHFQVHDLLHLLDDFLTAGPPASTLCESRLAIILHACRYLGIPVADEKTEHPTTLLTFLGILLDTVNLEARLPQDKLDELRHLLAVFSKEPHCTKRDLLSLLGKLNFAASVIVAGRTFMRRLWDAAARAPELHHRIILGPNSRADLQWWQHLLAHWNGKSFFLKPTWTPAPDLHLFTDAAGSVGHGAYFNGRWFNGLWTADQRRCCITYMELLPIALACSTWGKEWSSLRVEFHSDNQAVVAALRKGTCRCPNAMQVLREMFFVCVCQNFTITASYIPGPSNTIADSLSRQAMATFRILAPTARQQPDTICPLPPIPGEASLTPCGSTHGKL